MTAGQFIEVDPPVTRASKAGSREQVQGQGQPVRVRAACRVAQGRPPPTWLARIASRREWNELTERHAHLAVAVPAELDDLPSTASRLEWQRGGPPQVALVCTTRS